jgi:anaerobic magnesium-protoporphyrin IX monomethyl ester cyclase
MKILFIYSLFNIASCDKPLRSPELIQYGISYISSYLKLNGHSTELIVVSRLSGNKNNKIINEGIEAFHPDIIAFSPLTSEFEFVRDIARYIRKRYPGIHLSIGGFHVSLNPDGVLRDFDSLCIGEGEIPMLELVQQLQAKKRPSGIANFWFRNEDKIEKNPTRPFLQDLDALPFPDREIWQKWIKIGPNARHSVLLGRGCPFNCTYCCNHAIKRLATGKYTRYRSADNIVMELREITQKYPVNNNEIYMEVESIGVDKEWAVGLCEKLHELNKGLVKPLSFGVNLRITPNLDIDYLFPAFKKADINFLNIGLESGSERIRSEVLDRHYSNENIVNAVRSAKAYGFQVFFLNMVGLPGETDNDFKETIAINRKCQPDKLTITIFYPSPGTVLHTVCKNKKLIKKHPVTDIYKSAVIDSPDFSRKKIIKQYLWFEYNVYKGHRPLAKLLLQTLRLKMETNPLLFKGYKLLRSIKQSTKKLLERDLYGTL